MHINKYDVHTAADVKTILLPLGYVFTMLPLAEDGAGLRFVDLM